MQFDDYTTEELQALADAYEAEREEDGSRYVCEISDEAREYVTYMVEAAIADGADPDDAEDAYDSCLWDLDDVVERYGFISEEE